MPITAKFSQEFYDKLGHHVADELVDWFNQVDVTYRSQFRELFAVHFARFDAKLEQRVSELRAEFRSESWALTGRHGSTSIGSAAKKRLIPNTSNTRYT